MTRLRKACFGILAAALLLPAAAWPCGYTNSHSVRFGCVADFSWPPPLAGGTCRSRGAKDEYTPEAWKYFAGDEEWRPFPWLLDQARTLEKQGRYREAAEIYEKYCRRGPEQVPDKEFNSALDRIELFRDPGVLKGEKELRRYLHIRDEYYDRRDWDKTESGLMALLNQGDQALHPPALFLLASVQYRKCRYDQALSLYRKLLQDYPDSSKAASAEFMIAKCLFWQIAWKSLKEGEKQLKTSDQLTDYLIPNLTKRGEDEGKLDEAEAAFKKFVERHPKHLLAPTACCWLGGMVLAQGRKLEAVKIYLALLRRPDAQALAVPVLSSLYLTLGETTEAERKTLEKEMAKQPELLEPYLYFMLYYFWSGEDEEKAIQQHCAELAKAQLARSPRSALSRGLLVRLAQVAYREGDWGGTRRLADRAIRAGGSKQLLDEAYWMRAAAWHRSQQYWSAIRDYKTLLKEFPDSYLAGCALEELALLYETINQPGKALEVYFDLAYDTDVAWLVDIKMSKGELRRFIREHPAHPRKDFLNYALAIRYLREGDYRTARKYCDRAGNDFPGKEMDSPDARKTLLALVNWEKELSPAKNAGARAEILFQYARWLDDGPDTLIYNEPAWQQTRMDNLPPCLATPREWRLIIACLEKDNVLLRAADLYSQSAKLAPDPPRAAEALYAAGHCYLRVANYNTLLRELNPKRAYTRRAKQLFEMVAEKYPGTPQAAKAAQLARLIRGDEVYEGGGEHPWGPDPEYGK
jgi:TolA-binding protein